MAIITRSGKGSILEPEEVDNNFTELAGVNGKLSVTGVTPSSYTQQVDFGHTLASDDLILGLEVKGSLNSDVDAQIIDGSDFAYHISGNGIPYTNFESNDSVSAGNLGIKARNNSAVTQDITVKYWARLDVSDTTVVAYEAAAPVFPIAGVFDIDSATYSIAEDVGSLTIPVNRTEGTVGIATVDYTTADATATAGEDYTLTAGTLTFPEGVVLQNIIVPILEDVDAESSETFTVTLSNPVTGTSLGSVTTTTVTITDNDPAHETILDDMTGFAQAAGTTGGKGGAVVTVTNNNDTGAGSLRQAVTDATGPTWINFVGLGTVTITQATQLKLDTIGNENITIDGRGADITIAGEGIRLRQDSATEFGNFIFLNIKCDTTLTDCIQLTNNINKIWIHNCDFTDSPDEYISLTSTLGTSYQAPRGVTVSYCQMDDGIKGILTGGNETQTIDTNIRLTQHHNFFNGVNERAPRMRFAKVHSYNNYHFNWTSSAMFSSQDGELYSDGDIFEDGVDTLVGSEDNGIRATIASGDLTTGYAAVVNSVHLAAATLHTDANIDSVAPFPDVFDPTSFYTVTPDDPTGDSGVALKADIAANAGWLNTAFPT